MDSRGWEGVATRALLLLDRQKQWDFSVIWNFMTIGYSTNILVWCYFLKVAMCFIIDDYKRTIKTWFLIFPFRNYWRTVYKVQIIDNSTFIKWGKKFNVRICTTMCKHQICINQLFTIEEIAKLQFPWWHTKLVTKLIDIKIIVLFNRLRTHK